jgi:hypothetical protein
MELVLAINSGIRDALYGSRDTVRTSKDKFRKPEKDILDMTKMAKRLCGMEICLPDMSGHRQKTNSNNHFFCSTPNFAWNKFILELICEKVAFLEVLQLIG